MTSGVTLRSAADLIASVPYLLGFHPSDSVVAIAMRDEHVVFVARGDLVPIGPLAARMVLVMAREEATAVALVGYGPAAGVTAAIDVLREAISGLPVYLIDVVRVEDGRYWSYLCPDPSCCPPSGRPVDLAGSPVAASAVYNGQVALPDRASLAARIAPVGGPIRESMRRATERADDRLAELLAAATGVAVVRPVPPPDDDRTAGGAGPSGPATDGAPAGPSPGGAGRPAGAGVWPSLADHLGPVRRARAFKAMLVAGRAAVTNAFDRYRGGGRLSDDELAWLSVLIAVHLPVRDLAWERTSDEYWHVAMWTDILQRVEPDLSAGPASLLAFAAWRNGEGALASVAVQRALDLAPEYPLAHLMDEVLDQCLAPSSWKRRPPKAKAKRRSRRRRSS